MKNSENVKSLMKKEKFDIKKFFASWEMILVYIFIIINIVLMIVRPNLYFSGGTVSAIIRSGMDLSIMVLGMVMILLLGEIDISVGAIMILSAMVMGMVYGETDSGVLAVVCGICTGGVCGLINGLLVAKAKIPSVIVTIATAMVYRGIVKILLNDKVVDTFPEWFSVVSWEDAFGILPYSFICFIVLAVVFGVLLHKTGFGRRVYVTGLNKKVAEYSGIKVNKTVIWVFVIMGITSALSGILFSGRLSGISPSMAKGYELRVIAIVVLGGVSTQGGKGKIVGPIIATVVMAFLHKTLDLLSVQANIQKIIEGIILLVAVIIPVVRGKVKELITDKKRNRELRGEKC